jgi:hypothetical protein
MTARGTVLVLGGGWTILVRVRKQGTDDLRRERKNQLRSTDAFEMRDLSLLLSLEKTKRRGKIEMKKREFFSSGSDDA